MNPILVRRELARIRKREQALETEQDKLIRQRLVLAELCEHTEPVDGRCPGCELRKGGQDDTAPRGTGSKG